MKKGMIRKYLIAVLATLFTFAAVFAINSASRREALADNSFKETVQVTVNALNSENDQDTLKTKLPSKVSIKVEIDGAEDTWENIANVTEWGELRGYDSSKTTEYDVTCEATLSDASVTKDDKTVTIPSNTSVTATIHVAAATCNYSGTEPVEINALNSDDEAAIKRKLPPKVSIKVAVNGIEETWEDMANVVSWGDLTGYDSKKKEAYNVTCTGTLKPETVIKGDLSVDIPNTATVTATIHIAAATDTYEFENIGTTFSDIPETNGRAQAEIKKDIEKQYPKAKINIKKNGTRVTNPPTSTIIWNAGPEGTYDPTSTSASTLKWKGTIDSPVIYEGQSIAIPEANREVTVNINVEASTGYTFKSVVNPDPITVTDTSSDDEIKKKLPSKLSIIVTPPNSTTEEVWTDAVDVTWNSAKASSKNGIEAYYGTVAPGTVKKDGKTTNIPSAQSVSVSIISDYEQLIDNSSGLLSTETADGDYSIDVDISESKRKSILKYILKKAKDPLKSAIQNALINNTKMTFVFKADKTSPDSDAKKDMKKAVEKKSGAAICTYFDLTLKLKIGDKSYEVNDIGSGNSVEFKIKVPEDDRKSSRKYNAVRYHDGDAEVLNDSYKELDDKKFPFSTYLFSDYGISYTDSSSSSSSSSSTNAAKSNSAIVPGGGGTDATAAGGGTDKSKTPKTGDDFDPKIWIYLLIVCATVASASWILLQDTRDERKSGTGSKQ
jgi:hypothetical protein